MVGSAFIEDMLGNIDKINERETTVKRIDENQKVSLTLGQLKRLVRESARHMFIKERLLPEFETTTCSVRGRGSLLLLKYYNGAAKTEIVVPEGIEMISGDAFNFRTKENLVSLVLPSSLKWIDDFAFYGCDKLKRVNIPDGVYMLGRGAFENCRNLTDVEISDELMSKQRGINSNYIHPFSRTPFLEKWEREHLE